MRRAREEKARETCVCDLKLMGGGLFAHFQISQTAAAFSTAGVIYISLDSNRRISPILNTFTRDNT